MKKRFLVGILVLTMVVGAFAVNVYAADTNQFSSERATCNMIERSSGRNRETDLDNQERRESRNERREENINKDLEDGAIAEDEADEPRANLGNRDKFNEENSNRREHCSGRKKGRKHGHGMMHRRNK